MLKSFLVETKENLEKEQDSFGVKWKSLAPATLKARSYQKIKHNKKLFATGALNTSLNAGVQNDTAFVAVNASFKNFQYGQAHQFGTSKIPARAFFPFDKELKLNERVAKEMEGEVKDMLLKLFQKGLN